MDENAIRERQAAKSNDDTVRCANALEDALIALRNAKPDDRSEVARRYAVTITELEKVIAYFEHWVCR